jgi:hypothetical protein
MTGHQSGSAHSEPDDRDPAGVRRVDGKSGRPITEWRTDDGRYATHPDRKPRVRWDDEGPSLFGQNAA